MAVGLQVVLGLRAAGSIASSLRKGSWGCII